MSAGALRLGNVSSRCQIDNTLAFLICQYENTYITALHPLAVDRMAGVAKSRLHSTYLLNVKWGRKVLPVESSHQRQLFRGPGDRGWRWTPERLSPSSAYRWPHRQRDTAPLPFCPSALPYSTEPPDPWCYFPRLLIPGAARKWQDGPYSALRPVALARTSLAG